MQVGSREFRQEGLRFQSVRLFRRGELNDEVMRMIRGNIRTESGTLKDIQAMIAVCRAGEAYFHEILAKYGRDTVLDATRVYMEQSERRTRAELARDSRRARTARMAHFDNDGITLDQPVRVEMAITVGDGAMTVDFTGSSPQVAGPFNCGDAITISACRLLIKCLTTPLDPGGRGLLPAAARGHPPALGAGRRGAGADRALLRADQPADRPRAARAVAGHARPHPGRLLRRPDADHRLRHASGDRAGSSSRAISTPAAPGRGPPTTASRR